MTKLSHHKLTSRSGSVIPLISASLAAMALLGGGIYWFFAQQNTDQDIDPILSSVSRSDFIAKVLDQGEIQSAENVEIKCEVGSRNGNVTVIDVVAEGTMVEEGDWLVTLDAISFEKELEQQKVAVTNAETEVIQAQANFDAAVATKEEYINGTFVEDEKTIENELYKAQMDFEQATAFLSHSHKLQKKGFITKQQLRTDEIAVKQAQNSVELAEKKLFVLREISKKKEIALLESDIRAFEVKLRNEKESKKIEENQLAEIQKQLGNCEIIVPDGVSGEVVFAKEFDRRGGSEWVLEPGATVRERQVLIRLPNRDEMEVKVLINEQSITAIRHEMRALIDVDALNNLPLKGFVTKVNSYAEPGGWMSSSTVREYAVFVKILSPPPNLIPGMNASVTIQTEDQEGVLQAPLQCIYSAANSQYVLRQKDGKYETVNVTIGGENSQNVWITDGVDENDQLVMNPGAYKFLMDLPELESESRIELPEGTAMTSRSEGEDVGGRPQMPEGDKGDERGKRGKRDDRGGKGQAEGRDGKRGGGEGKRGGGFSVDSIVDRSMERYDSNGDGKIDATEQEEVDERMRDRIGQADTDGDGSVSKDELKKSMEKMFQQMRQGGGGGGGGRGGN